jgi:ComF family protein
MMARPLIKLLNSLDWSIDLVVPVPIGLARLAERGYNQAALLARPVAYALDIPYHSRALVKVKDTPSQVGLNLVERQANVRDAFFAKPGAVAGKSVLIIDDVTTSGSTINECAAVLLQAGSSKVYGLTLAHAAWTDDSGINQEDALSILEGIGSNT